MKKLKLVTILQSVVITGLILVVAGLLLLFRNGEQKSVPVSLEVPDNPEKEQQIKETEIIYETTGEKIFLNDSEFGEIWIPVLAGVPACQYQPEQYAKRNGLTYYTENNKVVSKFGIDVSAHQGAIDWQTVKSAGVDFAMIRVGYRGYSGGKMVLDEYFQRNVEGAEQAGIDIGLYFYSQAITPEEARQEAELVLSVIGDAKITYPVVYDWEMVTTDIARTDNVPVETLTQCNLAFCERIEEAGYIPMIYQNKRTSLLKLDLPELTKYDFWLAEYNDEATYYYNYQMWQYASDGHVPGINGEVDVNVCYKDYSHTEQEKGEEHEENQNA